jgi:hypothetical protein
MRGPDAQQAAMFNYVGLEERIPADHPLRAIRTMADRALRGLSPLFTKLYAPTGRDSIPPERLLRALQERLEMMPMEAMAEELAREA